MKTLKLVFTTAGKSDYNVVLDNPKDDLTLANCQSAAEKMIPILTTRSGVELTALKRAALVNSTEEDLA